VELVQDQAQRGGGGSGVLLLTGMDSP